MEQQNLSTRCFILSLLSLLSVKQSLSVQTYSLSYSYFDEIAQSYCASTQYGALFAVRRDCGRVAPTCNDICSRAKYEINRFMGYQRKRVSCFDAFYIKKEHPVLRANPSHEQPDAGKVNLGTYGYGKSGCSWRPNHCGPNYCCCKAY